VESWHLQGCRPRLCRLRIDGLTLHEQVLNVPIACWYTGLVSLVAYRQQRVALPPLLQWLPRGEKLGTDPQIGQSSCCELCQEPFFSGEVALSITIDDFTIGCYALTV
jgi:hypothetical protein